MRRGLLNFVVIGAKNSGKTVFLSTLFGMESYVASGNKETTQYLQANWSELKKGALPGATSGRIVGLEFEYKTDQYSVGFSIDDYDGYFVETLSFDDEHTQEDRNTLKKNIKEAEGLLFLFPFGKWHDEESLERFKHEINTFIELIKEIYPDRKYLPIPAIIAVSKWDQSPHFKAHDEHEKAIAYIESVEAYRLSMAKITTFFADVKVEPVSSFGKSEDGVHPVKGEIEPYNIGCPFEYFLSVTFQRFEEKAAKLQADKDYPKLFKFLSAIYNDVRFYKEGKLIKLYKEVETKYALEVISKLKAAAELSQQEEILNENAFLYDNLKNKQLAQKITGIVNSKRAKIKKKRIIALSAAIVILLTLGYGTLAYKAHVEERNAFTAIKQLDPKTMPKELSERCIEYLAKYSRKSILLPFTDIAGHREEVEMLLSSAKSVVVAVLRDGYERLKSREADEENLAEIRDLAVTAELFPDMQISMRVAQFAGEFERHIKQKKETVKTISEAKALLATDSDISEIEEVLARLNKLPEDERTTEIKRQLLYRMQTLELREAFDNLYNEVKVATSIPDIPKLVGRQWLKEFPKESMQTLNALIQDKIAKQDRNAINDLKERFESAPEVQEQERNLADIEDNFIEIPQIDYRYQRDPDLINRFDRAKKKTAMYRNVLTRGVLVTTIVFGAGNKDNEPLGFSCGPLGGNEIMLRINDVEYSYKDAGGCNAFDNGRQEIWWKTPRLLKSRRYAVMVTEKDVISDDTTTGLISISKNDILKIHNQGGKEFTIPNTGYFIAFRK